MKNSFAFITCCLIFSSFAFASVPEGFVDPMAFDGSEAQKQQVIKFITKNVDATFCKALGQCSATLLRTMEEAELDSFKNLTVTAKDHPKEYTEVYKTYCEGIGQCNYSALEMMYEEEFINASKKLTW